MKKVLAFGTFDHLHPGHSFFLAEAKKLGDHLTVVVGRDVTVSQVKHHLPKQSEVERLAAVAKDPAVDKARLGNTGEDKLKVIEEEKPDIIALGYDQKVFVDLLLEKYSGKIQISWIEAFQPDIYKSSKLR